MGYTLDENNAALITDEMKAKADEITEKIATGEIQVHNYLADDNCPDLSFE